MGALEPKMTALAADPSGPEVLEVADVSVAVAAVAAAVAVDVDVAVASFAVAAVAVVVVAGVVAPESPKSWGFLGGRRSCCR